MRGRPQAPPAEPSVFGYSFPAGALWLGNLFSYRRLSRIRSQARGRRTYAPLPNSAWRQPRQHGARSPTQHDRGFQRVRRASTRRSPRPSRATATKPSRVNVLKLLRKQRRTRDNMPGYFARQSARPRPRHRRRPSSAARRVRGAAPAIRHHRSATTTCRAWDRRAARTNASTIHQVLGSSSNSGRACAYLTGRYLEQQQQSRHRISSAVRLWDRLADGAEPAQALDEWWRAETASKCTRRCE